MKKLIKIAILCVCLIMSSFGLLACGTTPPDPETGLQITKYKDEDFYTVHGYVDDGETAVLDLQAIAGDDVVIGRIKKGAFSGNSTITELIVPSTVEIIDDGAFSGMRKLQKITIPFVGNTAIADSYIGETEPSTEKSTNAERNFGYVFGTAKYDYSTASTQKYNSNDSNTYYLPLSLREVVIAPANDYTIPAYAFEGNDLIRKITLTEKVVGIGYNAFDGCSVLNNISYIDTQGETQLGLSATLATIGDYAFANTTNLKDSGFKFNAQNAVAKLGKYAFNNAGLNQVELPDNLTELGEGCFSQSKLTAITSNGVSVVGNNAFYACEELVSANFGAVENVGHFAFANCKSLIKFNSATENEIDLTGVVNVCANAFTGLTEEGETLTVKGAPANIVDVMGNTTYNV